ncbi:MAG: ATP-binding protein [Gammaproteobacteria bacterium]
MKVDLNQLFTIAGAVTVDRRHQFAGRETLLKDAFQHLMIAGTAVALYGERGVGKTSAGWQLFAGLSGDFSLFKDRGITLDPPRTQIRCVWLKCTDFIQTISDLVLSLLTDSGQHSLAGAFPDVFTDAEIARVSKLYGWERGTAQSSSPKGSEKSLQPSNSELAAFKALEDLLKRAAVREPKTQLVIFLDEFEQVKESTRVGVLLKALNNVKFVIVGMATNRETLIGQHPSVVRKLNSYEVPLFTAQNVGWFFDSLETSCNKQIRFDAALRTLIANKSSGFPWLVQQLGYYSALNADERRGKEKTLVVLADDYHSMIKSFLTTKLGNTDFDFGTLSTAGKQILVKLADTPKGRRGEADLIKSLDPNLHRHFDRGIQELEKINLVQLVGKEVRVTDPLTKVLVTLAISERVIQ